MKIKNIAVQKNKSIDKGITMVELIIYVALLMIFITGVVTFGIEIIGIRAKARVQQEVIYNSRAVAKRIAFEVRNASAINSVTSTSISFANADTNRNPTVITKSGSRVTISWSATNPPCPAASPCFLTSSDVSVDKMTFSNMSDGGGKTASVKFDLTVSSVNSGGRKDWSYAQSMTGNAELRSK